MQTRGGSVFLKGGLASVVLACGGGPGSNDASSIPRLRRCVESLLRWTRRPCELIAVVDPRDEAAWAYLEGVRDAAPIYVELVAAEAAAEWPEKAGGLRHAPGVSRSCGGYLALIDDTITATEGWLDDLIALADWNPQIALVGPVFSAGAPPAQRAEGGEGLNHAAAAGFAGRWREEHLRQWIATDALLDACVVVRRETYDELAEPTPRSWSELTTRALDAGRLLAINRAVYIHGFTDSSATSTSIAAAPAPAPRRAPTDAAPILAPPPPASSPATSPARPLVSLTMIVRDAADDLAACLDSASGVFDEIVVVDTGSTDATAEVARSRGARVVAFEWIDDFAAARNAALDAATGRYAFWLDADDRLDEAARASLRPIFAGLEASPPAAYGMKQVSTTADPQYPSMIVDHIRLFPIRPDVRWTQRIHEQILPTVSAAGLPIHWTDVAIPHHGYSDRATTDRKLDRNLRILGIELLEKPGNPTVLFNIGWAALSKRDARTAAGYLRASIAASTPYDGLLRQAYVLLAEAMAILGDLPAALAVCDAGLTFADDDAGLRFCRALLSQESGDPASAEADLRRILEGPAPRRYSISNPGIRGHLSRRRLASLLERRGATGEALRLWSEVLQERPDDPEAQTALARLATKSTSSAFAAAG